MVLSLLKSLAYGVKTKFKLYFLKFPKTICSKEWLAEERDDVLSRAKTVTVFTGEMGNLELKNMHMTRA